MQKPFTMDDIVNFSQRIFDTTGFSPRWQSTEWDQAHPWLHIGLDLAAGLAYLLLVTILAKFTRRRPDVRHSGFFFLVRLLLVSGAAVHLLDAAMFWWPAYRLLALVMAFDTVALAAAALALWPRIPKALELRNPVDLQREIAQRRRTEMELRQVHVQLEGVIEQRTAELATKNEEMEQFLNTVTHDLKNPIVTCLGLIGMARQDIQAGQATE